MDFSQPSSGPIMVRAATVALVAGAVTMPVSDFGLSHARDGSVVLAAPVAPAGTQISHQYECAIAGSGTQIQITGLNAAAGTGDDDTSVLTVFLIDPAGVRHTPEGYGAALEVILADPLSAGVGNFTVLGGDRVNQRCVVTGARTAGSTTLGVQYQASLNGATGTVTARAADGTTATSDVSSVNVFVLNTDFAEGHRLAPSGKKAMRSFDLTLAAGVGTVTPADVELGGFPTGTIVLTQLLSQSGTIVPACYQAAASTTQIVVRSVSSSGASGTVTADGSTVRLLIVTPDGV